MLAADTRYELPRARISLLGYLCRRAHKTRVLVAAAERVRVGDTASALREVGRFAAAAAVSFGRAYYQPTPSAVGDVHREPDPATGIMVTAELIARQPVIRSRITVEGPGWSMVLDEQITGTTFGLGTLAMPAPSSFTFSAGEYRATAAGTVVTELIPLPGATRVRGHGELSLSDSADNRGAVTLSRKGVLTVDVGGHSHTESLRG